MREGIHTKGDLWRDEVRDVMTPGVVAAPDDATVADAARALVAEPGVTRLAVRHRDHGLPAGVVTRLRPRGSLEVGDGRVAAAVTTDSASERITIVLADDHSVVRTGLRMLLEAERDMEVVAEAGDVGGATRYVLGHKPTVLVLDLNMPGGSSLEAIPALGHTNNEIADQLFLSVRTVETHRAHIQQKLGVSKRAELVRYALDNDLIDR